MTATAEMNGIEAIRGKHEWWDANNEVHSLPQEHDRDGAVHGERREDRARGVLLQSE